MWDRLLPLVACVVAGVLIVSAFLGYERRSAQHEAAGMAFVGAQAGATSVTGATPRTSNVAAAVRAPARNKPRKTKASATPTPQPRASCTELRSAHDRTRAERQWFIDQCLFAARRTPQALASLLRAQGLGVSAAGNGRSASSATPPPWLTNVVAVAEAVAWMESRAPLALNAYDQTCVPIWLNGHWVVTCQVSLVGCSGPQCVASLSLCVFSTEPLIVTDPNC
jgi:hypothetical protein